MTAQSVRTWRDKGRCRGVDPDVFYPLDDDACEAAAKMICAGCAVREACLDHAIVNRERIGVWGGLGERERRRLIRQRRRTA